MRVLLSGYYVETGRVGGAEESTYDLAHGFRATGQDVTFLCRSREALSVDFRRSFLSGSRCRLRDEGSRASRFLLEQRICTSRDLTADLTIFPNYFTPVAPPARLGHVTTIIHDLQYCHYPEYWPLHKRLWLRAAHRLTLSQAHSVAVISPSVRQDILDFYGPAAAQKVRVIPNPVTWSRFDPPREPVESGLPLGDRPYILTVGAHYAHKNLETLVRAFREIVRGDPDVLLVIAGQFAHELRGRFVRRDVRSLIAELGLEDRVVVTGYLDGPELGLYFRNCTVFAFPSLFEGFGRPPVEALGLGIPTVTTRACSLEDATLKAAMYVKDPLNEHEWASILSEVLRTPSDFGPSSDQVEAIRHRYDPARIARAFLALAEGRQSRS